MAYEFKLPDLGEGITSGEIKKWDVRVGQRVEEDEPLAEVETDKAVVEIPAPVTGTVQELRYKEGDQVPVGSVMAVIQPAGEAKAEVPPVQEKAVEKATAEAKKPATPTPAPAPAPAAGPKVPVLATPATRMLAKELKVDINAVKGSGPYGRITDEDVRAAAGKPAEAKAPPTVATPVEAARPGEKPAPVPAAAPAPAAAAPEERVPLRGIRRTIAENLTRSLQRTAQVTAFDDADVTRLSLLRQQVDEKLGGGTKISFLAFVVKAVVAALRAHPMLNASVDDERQEIVLKKYYHIGIAIDTPRGLMVAPVRDADRKNLVQIAKEIKELVELAQSGRIGVEQLRGGTFTITNIGAIGGLWSTPIINYPEAAILQMQQIREVPRAVDGVVAIRRVMNLCLTIDHRIIDGAEGQRFLNDVKRYLEDPQMLMVEMV
ncbi:MAG TPA: dihydrolipoamide acetyltransferase family protein [Methanocella sp.]|nr:dihydrolipoamide acetyltransferase family protein [Methanocella sp.]